ncbi:similar to Saccharomyces cerevisiae YBR162W-A YSY6 Protein that participates in secretory pathway [Geotrichum candidum]|uniref:Stress-associated endoplasmic reticulum protein n=1 Tax=Geotrichum candidum TaxID=1173061 RepID=A0A0J9XEF1_GEOCN|nr:similar to Saccharomyces cerevisiae YBR162W-A YSY6 Protein that participates in secretory pathway [Geotrichum candidum]
MAQTPIQRRANEKFARREEKKKGKPTSSLPVKKEKSPISASWLFFFGFLIMGGAIFELLRLFGLF